MTVSATATASGAAGSDYLPLIDILPLFDK